MCLNPTNIHEQYMNKHKPKNNIFLLQCPQDKIKSVSECVYVRMCNGIHSKQFIFF